MAFNFQCCATMSLCFLFIISLLTLAGYLFDGQVELPEFKVSSTSATVKDISGNQVTADLKIGFGVRQVNNWGVMSYDNITASAFLNHNNNEQHLFDIALLPFRQRESDYRIVNVSLDDAAVDVENWVNNTTGDKKSGMALLNLELSATMTFHGGTWVKPHKTPIKVVCKDVEVQFSSNSTINLRFCPELGCRVGGTLTLWRKKIQLLVSDFT